MGAPTSLTVSGLIFVGLGVLIGWILFPNILHSQIEKNKMLKKGTETRKFWVKFPISLDFKIYVFNVTNPDDVIIGKKPIVKEIGPYYYHEWKEKEIIEDNAKDDTVSYNFKNTFIFNQTLSSPLTGNETITMPHPMVIAMAQATARSKPGALGMINKGIPFLFPYVNSFMVTAKAREILFDGLLVNCTKHKEFAPKSICEIIRDSPKGLEVVDENFKFSFFGAVNGTIDTNIVTVKRGMTNVLEVGSVVAFNGKPTLELFDGEFCNRIKGTDTTIFPPFMNKPDDVWSFGAEICRSLPAKYVRDKDYDGVHGYYYTADLGDQSTVPEEKCFCESNDTCLKKGAYDLFKCTGAPIIATLPHFYLSHPDYQNGVGGLSPTEEHHGIYSTFEPVTGTPLEGRKRLQFNVFLKKVPKITVFKDLPEENPVLLPLIWVEEGADLNSTFTGMLKMALYTSVKIVNIVRWVMVVGGVGMIMLAILIFYQRSNLDPGSADGDRKTNITQVSPAY